MSFSVQGIPSEQTHHLSDISIPSSNYLYNGCVQIIAARKQLPGAVPELQFMTGQVLNKLLHQNR